jgi:4-azaleucine resistance transporter AzlC
MSERRGSAGPPGSRTSRQGLLDGVPYAGASAVLGISFGVLAADLGFPGLATVVMSAVVFAGAAQFAAVGIFAAGGGVPAAVGAAALMNSRFVPMGLALGPSLRGSRTRRALEGQTVADVSWAMAATGDGRFDRAYLFGHASLQYAGWVGGTAVGVVLPGLDARALGLDAVVAAFFLTILAGELRDRRRVLVAVFGAAIALVLVGGTPPGVPVLVASTAALVGLRRPPVQPT